jgi:hypothetical protein
MNIERPACKVSPLKAVVPVTLSLIVISLFACNVTLPKSIADERVSPLIVDVPVGLLLKKLFPATGSRPSA